MRREDVNVVKDWLRQRREGADLSQSQLGVIAGVGGKTIGNLERHTSDTALGQGTTLWPVLQALGVISDAPPAHNPLQELRDELEAGMAALARGIERIEARLDESGGQARGNGH